MGVNPELVSPSAEHFARRAIEPLATPTRRAAAADRNHAPGPTSHPRAANRPV